MEASGGATAAPLGESRSGKLVRMQLLGPLAVWRDGALLRLGGGKQRAVLGLLGLHPDAVVSLEAIAEVLWEGEPPPTAAAMVQSHISRLRAVLDHGRLPGGRGGSLEAAGAGYCLRTGQVELDLMTYRRLAGEARDARRAGDAVGAFELYERALGLWHGEPLADVALLRGHPALTGLSQEQANVVVEYAEAASAMGGHDQVLPHLQALAGRDPLNERAHACLMIALAGSGRQAAALEAYEQMRRRLDDQLGVGPGAALADAHLRVLRHDIPGAAPSPGAAVSGGPVDHGGPPDGAPWIPACQLPPVVADFTGRSEQVALLRGMLGPDDDRAGVPVVVISGAPGAGKTTLMVHAGHVMRPFFPDGQLWAQLDGASDRPRDPGDVLGELLRALGVHGSAVPGRTGERAALYRSRLADRRVLIVVDDAASAAQVRPLLPGTAGCAVMVTSRRRLAELPGAKLLPLGPLTLGEATDLLGRITGHERVTAEWQAAGDLASGCGHLPLAVRIAGAKLAARPSAPIAVLARAVTDERNRLSALQIGDLSIRASLASGYQSLSVPARRAFRLLGLLGPCDVAEWVIAALLDEPDAGEVVNELCDRSMLTLTGTDLAGQARFRLHDLLRDYACEELECEPVPARQAALGRARAGWLQLAARASASLPREPFLPPGSQSSAPRGVIPDETARHLTANPLAWFAAERLNLLTVTADACTTGQYDFAAQLALCQAEFQHLQDRHDEVAYMWRAIASAAAAAGDAPVLADARLRLGAAAVERGYAPEAMDLLEECVATFEYRGDLRNLAYALYWRGASAWDMELLSAARSDAERGVALGRQVADPYAEFTNLRLLGLALGRLGEAEQAIAACEHALAIAVGLGEKSCESVALHNLSFACVLTGRYERALGLVMRQLELCRELGEVRYAALALGVRGDAYHGLGRYDDEVAALLQALPAFRSHSIRRHQALCLSKIGYAYQAMGSHQLAAQYLAESLPIFRELGLASYEQRAIRALGDCRRLSLA